VVFINFVEIEGLCNNYASLVYGEGRHEHYRSIEEARSISATLTKLTQRASREVTLIE